MLSGLTIVDTVTATDEVARLMDLEQAPLSVAVIDIDEFASVNATFGRAIGDKVIDLVYRALHDAVGEGALVARTGGDEFLVALPGTAPERALMALESVRAKLARPQDADGATLPVRFSAGIASFPHHAEGCPQLCGAAQEALHRAKSEGANRTAIYVEEKMVLKSNYYSRAQLSRLAALAHAIGKTEASLLRQALVDLLDRHRELT